LSECEAEKSLEEERQLTIVTNGESVACVMGSEEKKQLNSDDYGLCMALEKQQQHFFHVWQIVRKLSAAPNNS
jgi:hypothetical protein